ncbi:hypothetical protein BDV28DRAFT_164873 [Aspergillus coremiiformis]|uniref:Rhodopsin domain-containing protein n=1 Tax=Aspergillus coremiiformis TaxID=138285 RepID=A0A5N6YRY2_9EURO|nr:hypothetical protein BDV28DRAFT_164873 [Aspergillus coremiiformis]
MSWVYNLERPDPNSDTLEVITICLVFPITALVAVALRFFIRIHTKRSIWLDDYAALYSAVMVSGYSGNTILQTRWGLGLHAEYLPAMNVKTFGKIQYAGGPIYVMGLLGFKVSLLASYLRIGGFIRKYRIIITMTIVAVVINQLLFACLLIFHLVYDIVILTLPLPVLRGLKLDRRQKIALYCVFAIGFFITIIQIFRITSIRGLQSHTDSKSIILWSTVEVSLAAVIACVPIYGPYFRVFVSNISSYRRRPSPDLPLSCNRHTRTSTGASDSRQSHDQPSLDLPSTPQPYDNGMSHQTTISSSQRVEEDNDSQEHILGAGNRETLVADAHGRIRKVMEIRVERH